MQKQTNKQTKQTNKQTTNDFDHAVYDPYYQSVITNPIDMYKNHWTDLEIHRSQQPTEPRDHKNGRQRIFQALKPR